jgi:hypothetical protein
MSGDRITIELDKMLTVNSGGEDSQFGCEITLSLSIDPATGEYQRDSVSVEDVECHDLDVNIEDLYAEAELCVEDWEQDITEAVELYFQRGENE